MPLGTITLTVSARTNSGVVSIQAGSVEYIVPPTTLSPSTFFALAFSEDGGTDYYDWLDNDGKRIKYSPSVQGLLTVGIEAHKFTHIKVLTEHTEPFDRVFTFVLGGAAGGAGLMLSLDAKDYPIAAIESIEIADDLVPPMRIGLARWDQQKGAFVRELNDFSGVLGEQIIDLEAERIGWTLMPYDVPSLDGSMGYLTGPPAFTVRGWPVPSMSTTKAVVPTSIACSSDIAGDGFPRVFMGVGNEVWRTEGVAGSPVITNGVGGVGDPLIRETNTGSWTYVDGGGGADTITGTGVGTGLLAGDRIIITGTANNNDVQTIVSVVANTITLATGKLTAEGAVSSTIKTGTIPGATQITSIIPSPDYNPIGLATKGLKSLLITAATGADVDISIYQSLDGATLEKAGTSQGFGSLAQYAEQVTLCDIGIGGLQNMRQSAMPVYATRDGSIWGMGTSTTGLFHLAMFYNLAKVQFLGSAFADLWGGLGIWFIGGSTLYNMVFPVLGNLRGTMGSTPQFPPLTCGCMYMRKPCVTDGMNVWLVEGDTARWIGIPPQVLSGPAQAATGYRYSIETLTAAGHLLVAGLKGNYGSVWTVAFAVYDDQSGQWRMILQFSTSTSEPEIHGAFLGPLSAPADVTAKHLWVSYSYGSNSYVTTIHLPRGFVGTSNIDDTFTAGYWALPAFDGGDAVHDGPLIELSIEAELYDTSSAHAFHTLVKADGSVGVGNAKTDLSFTGSGDGVGLTTKTWTPAAGEAFTNLYIAFISALTYTVTGASDISFTSPDTITDTGSDFGTFSIGDSIIISGTTNNNGTFTVVTVSDSTITVASGITTEGNTSATIYTGSVTNHPVLRKVIISWRKRRDTRLQYKFLIDTRAWMRANSKNIKQLLAQLATSRDKNVLVAAYVDRSSGVEENIIGTSGSPIYVEIQDAVVEHPGSLAAEAIGYTRLVLEEPV